MSEVYYFLILTIGSLVLFFVIIQVTKFYDKPIVKDLDTYKYPEQISGLKENFLKSIEKKQDGSFVILDFENYYLQYLLLTNSGEIWCEAVSNEFLKVKDTLSNIQIERLLNEGFIKPYENDKHGNQMANYRKLYKATSTNDFIMIIDEGIRIIEEIYELPRQKDIVLHYESNQV